VQIVSDVLDVAGERHARFETIAAHVLAQFLLAAVERAIAAAHQHQVRVRMLAGDASPDFEQHQQAFGARESARVDRQQTVRQREASTELLAIARDVVVELQSIGNAHDASAVAEASLECGFNFGRDCNGRVRST
jgi:hypothetical protein